MREYYVFLPRKTPKHLDGVRGLYFIFNEDYLLYIGITKSLSCRIYSHQKNMNISFVIFFPHLDNKEIELIKIFTPPLNKIGNVEPYTIIDSDGNKLFEDIMNHHDPTLFKKYNDKNEEQKKEKKLRYRLGFEDEDWENMSTELLREQAHKIKMTEPDKRCRKYYINSIIEILDKRGERLNP